MELDEETIAEKEAGNLQKLSVTNSLSSSVSSVRELLQVSGLCQAYKRVSREDRNQREKGEPGLSFKLPLARQLSVRLDKLDLISRDQRLSVIVTPSRKTSTSTPSNSPQPPPLVPRTCQPLLGPTLPPEHPTHSPTCTDLSSIDGDVFYQEVDASLNNLLYPPSFRYHAQTLISGIMQEQEKELVVKQKMLYLKMRSFDPVDIDDNMKIFNDAFYDFMEGTELLLLSHSDSLGTARVEQWKTAQSTTEKDSIEYRKLMP